VSTSFDGPAACVSIGRARGGSVSSRMPSLRSTVVLVRRSNSNFREYDGSVRKSEPLSSFTAESWRRRMVAISVLIPGRLYAGTKPACIFVSDDGGGSKRELTGFATSSRAGSGSLPRSDPSRLT
jgi:hypothetical protein